MPLTTILIVALIVLVVMALPRWGWSQSWGYGPSGVIGIILLILLVLFLTGRL